MFRGGKSKLYKYTKHSLLIINLLEQQVYTVVQLSELAKNLHLLSLSIFLYPVPRSKNFSYIKNILKTLYTSVVTKIGLEVRS